jgi:hypothetical protein
MQRLKDTGPYEFAVMLAATAAGYLGGPLWIAATAGLLLTLLSFQEYSGLQPRLARVGGTRLLAGAMLMTALTCLGFASLCFGIGRVLRWLLSA